MSVLTLQDYVDHTRDSSLITDTTESGVLKTTQVTALIDAANSFILEYCTLSDGTQISFETVYGTEIFVPKGNITTITQIEDPTDDTIIPDTEYRLLGDKIIFNSVTYNSYLFKVTYETDLQTFAGLNALKKAGCLLVDYWNKKEFLPSRTTGTQTTASPKDDVPPQVSALLDLHRTYVV